MPAKKIINDEQLLSLMHGGLNKKDAAKRQGVSPAAVGKRLRQIMPSADSILEKYDLTDKEKAFVLAKAKGKTNTQAAMSAYETTSLESAKSLGSALMKKPEIQQSIPELMDSEGLTERHIVRKTKNRVDSVDENVSLRGIDIACRLRGLYKDRDDKQSNIALITQYVMQIRDQMGNDNDE
jgi:hypothetical protein